MANYCMNCGYFKMGQYLGAAGKPDIETTCNKHHKMMSPLKGCEDWTAKGKEIPLPPIDYSKIGHRVCRTDYKRLK